PRRCAMWIMTGSEGQTSPCSIWLMKLLVHLSPASSAWVIPISSRRVRMRVPRRFRMASAIHGPNLWPRRGSVELPVSITHPVWELAPRHQPRADPYLLVQRPPHVGAQQLRPAARVALGTQYASRPGRKFGM